MKKILVVIPTYNEKENIPLMVEAIFALQGLDISILVVDDNSPDGTGKIVKDLKQKYPKVFLLDRKEKEGLGRAYLHAFSHALENFEFDYLVQMDVDFSHNPKDIPRLIKELDKGFDTVIGSRHMKGAELHYSWFRRFLSGVANLYAKTILNLKVQDCTAGFRAYKREVVETFIKERFYSRDYAFQNEILFYVSKYGFKIKEIPVIFEDRIYGKSKMSLWNVVAGAIGVFKIRLRNVVVTRPYLYENYQKVKKVVVEK